MWDAYCRDTLFRLVLQGPKGLKVGCFIVLFTWRYLYSPTLFIWYWTIFPRVCMLGCAFSVFGTDIHAMRNHKKNHGERNAPDWGSTSTFDDNWIQYRFGRLAFGTFLETSDLWVAPRQCLLLPHHPSLAPLLEESGLLGEVPPPSKHVMAFCCEWWWNSELRPHTILHPQYKGIYTWFTIHESDSECDFLCWWIWYCFA